ncbi:hypothetical protein JIN86_05525 [Lysinibacillus sp. HST-98]|uniref:hypothetical protein n=1 Tax=Lysinibacillus sp. HST-98 TaxID=2800419 RepID=UPI0019260CA0|nr:hypothetical protein [Lysinibacillus sp. HST-98]MBL3729057.1 hypothetical protein [Lysinibacillus sp. HST-98]
MKYGPKLNLFLAENTELTNEKKAEEVANLETDDLFDLMRNIEEAQDKYDRMVIKAVAGALLAKNIFLF